MGSEAYAEVSLADIADFRNGKAIPPEKYTPNGKHPVFGSNGQIACSDEVLCPDPTIVIGRVGAYCGCVHYVPTASWVTDNAIVASPQKGNDLRYLYYLLGSLELERTAIGSAQPLMTQKGLKVVQTKVPPLPEQKAIAHILGSLDDKIELNRKMNATLEAMAQALFKSWFVDFDPVIDNALATGNPIPDELAARAEVRRQALADGTANREAAKLFPAAFKETESMGWIPEGWEHNTIGKLIEVTDYVANGSFASLKANVTLSDDPDYALYVRTTDFKHGFSLSKAKYTTKSSYDFLKKSRLFGDEIIISNVGDTGTVFRPPVWRGEPMTLGSNAIAVKTAKDCHYFYEYFRSDFGQHQISGIVGGSAQPKFNKTDFRSLHLHLPPQQIRKVYCESVECIWERHISVLRNNEALTKIRDTLLPKLISGELRIEDAERIADLETKEISS